MDFCFVVVVHYCCL